MKHLDLLYLACNRLAFTQETFNTLLQNTDWEKVQTLFIIDDGSIDGTFEWLNANVGRVPGQVRLLRTRFCSPVSAMVYFINLSNAPILAKIDNDTMVPPGWLRQCLDVLDRHPELDLLGIEAMYPHVHDLELPRDYAPAQFISGLGLYRSSVFSSSKPKAYLKYYGLEEWQVTQRQKLVRGWITPALPVFLLDRTPLQPWITWSQEYEQKHWQRSWPKYPPNCTLWHWRWPATSTGNAGQVTAATQALASETFGDPRYIAALRVKNESDHIQEVLNSALRFCGRAYVFDDHSEDNTVSLCNSFTGKVTVFQSPFHGLDEARDKNYLLQQIIAARPEWVLWIDGDEVLESAGPNELSKIIRIQPHAAAFSLRIAYLWDDPGHVRVDGVYGQFRRPSLFRLRGQTGKRLYFRPTGHGGNFHCGNVPNGLHGPTVNLDVRLKHYGYMNAEQRTTKYEWYRKIDPHNELEDDYRHLVGIPGSRYAPGPLEIIPWVE